MSRLLWVPASRPSQAWLVEGLPVEALGKSRPSGMLSTSTALQYGVGWGWGDTISAIGAETTGWDVSTHLSDCGG